MIDVQSQADKREVYLNEVGISGLRFPAFIENAEGKGQATVATASLSVDLNSKVRGTHMSRFVEVINKFSVLNYDNIRCILEELIDKLQSDSAYIRLSFPYFIDKKSPVSQLYSGLDIDCVIKAGLKQDDFSYTLGLLIPIMTLCPCSKEISKYGAHNQRAVVDLEVKAKKDTDIEELADIVESCASSPLYPLLKRPDEKYVTEKAYENPYFVEDVVRELYNKLEKKPDLTSFKIKVKSMESIHNHDAFAIAVKREE